MFVKFTERVRLLWDCVNCRVQSKTVIGVCKVHSAVCDSYLGLQNAQCRVILLLVCVKYTM